MFNSGFNFGGKPDLYPPCLADVLAWYMGTVYGDVYLKDFAPALGNFPFEMVDGPCLTFNGVDEWGTADKPMNSDSSGYIECAFVHIDNGTNHILASSGGGVPNRCYVASKESNVIGGGIGEHSYTDIYGTTTLIDGVSYVVRIEWDGTTVILKLDGNVEYSGPQVGTPDTSNNSEVGRFNPIAASLSVCNVISVDFNGTFFPFIGKTSTLNPTNVYATDGTKISIESSDYATMWICTQDTYFYEAENGYWEDVNGRYPYAHAGATYVKGNTWNNSMNSVKLEDPVLAALITMDTDNMFINTDGEALTINQTVIEECGAELQTNNHFTTDLAGYSITTNWAWESPGVARHTIGSVVPLTSSITLTDAIEFEITFTVGGSTAGTVTPYAGSGAAGTARSNGKFTERLTCTTTTDFLLTPTTDFDGWVDNVSVRKVDPLINFDDKMFFGSRLSTLPKQLTLYQTALTGDCLVEAKDFHGL